MRERLEDVIRPGEVAEDLVLLLRGGVHADGIDRLRDLASKMNRRFSLEGGDCYGISAFAATEESEAWILARNMAVRRRYDRVRYEDVSELPVLPTFRAPHWTVLFDDPTAWTTGRSWTPWVTLRDNPHWR